MNAASRIVERYGRLLDVDGMAPLRKRDPALLPPMTLFRYQRELEAPDVSEGFARVDAVPFERRPDPSRVNRAVIVWLPAEVNDLVVDPRQAAALRRYAEQGYRLLGLSWQPDVGEGKRTAADVEATFAKMNEQLGARDRGRALPARRRPAALLVPQTPPGTWRAADPSSPTGSGTVHLRRGRIAGRRLRGAVGISVPRPGARVL